MTTNVVTIKRFDADEGKVFDYAEPRFEENEKGEQVQVHLYAKTLYLGVNDNISNYVEVERDG